MSQPVTTVDEIDELSAILDGWRMIVPPCEGEGTGRTALINDEFVVVLPHTVAEYRPDWKIRLSAA